MDNQTTEQIKADAVNNFVCTMIGALEAGFVGSGPVTLAEIHLFARQHVKLNYAVDLPSLEDQWGKEVATLCGTPKNICPTLGSTCRGCPDCQPLPVGDDATNEALRLEMENNNG